MVSDGGNENARHRIPPARYAEIYQDDAGSNAGEDGTRRNRVEELRAMLPDLLETVREYLSLLRSGRANPMELVLRRHITKEAEEYTNNSISAVVSKLVESMGVHLSAGESIEFIILDQSGKHKPEKAKPLALYAFEDGYDIETYTEFALKAAATLLEPFGYSFEALEKHFDINQKKPRSAARNAERHIGTGVHVRMDLKYAGKMRIIHRCRGCLMQSVVINPSICETITHERCSAVHSMHLLSNAPTHCRQRHPAM